MASYKTATATAQDAALDAGADFSQRPDARNIDGKLCRSRVYYTLLGTEAAAEVLKLCHLPKGARVIPGLCKVTPNQDPGTALKFDIGTLGDPDAFADAIVLSAGEKPFFDSAGLPAASVADKAIGEGALLSATRDDQSDNAVYATFDTATTLTAGTILAFDIVFSIP